MQHDGAVTFDVRTGLIYHSTFIGRAAKKNKGRVSRYLANKCAMASRIDAFADELTDKYGISMREQVEERLKFFDSGETPRRNVDVMQEVAAQLRAERGEDVEMSEAPSSSKKDKKAKKKRKEASGDVELLKAKKKKKKKSSA